SDSAGARDHSYNKFDIDEGIFKHFFDHQKDGINFVLKNCFEGQGCILAHCMGLGKTAQIIASVDALVKRSIIKSTLILCPMILVENWAKEFKEWLQKRAVKKKINVQIFLNVPKEKRVRRVEDWHKNGGVLIMSYETFTSSLTEYKNTSNPHSSEDEDFDVRQFLQKPGPDLLVCDEGHRLSSPKSALYKAVYGVQTKRKVLVTGTPFQNNFNEIFYLGNLVQNGVFGELSKFKTVFEEPINQGKFKSSSRQQVATMKGRVFVLHQVLNKFIHRKDISILAPKLKPKLEFVVYVPMTKIQCDLHFKYLYEHSNKAQSQEGGENGFFNDYNTFELISAHPCALGLKEDEAELPTFPHDCRTCPHWWTDLCQNVHDDIEYSNKMKLLFSIIDQMEDTLGPPEGKTAKLLVFSQRIQSLRMIEHLLQKSVCKHTGNPWKLGEDFFKLTGQTKNRQHVIDKFNKSPKARILLMAKKASGLGINLVSANRVVIFEPSWNPTLDAQSVFRAYRLKQVNSTYVYRFISYGGMEQKAYERSINKLATSKRIFDMSAVDRKFDEEDLIEMYNITQIEGDEVVANEWLQSKDALLHKVCGYKCIEHDSLLGNTTEVDLTQAHKRAAIEDFNNELRKPGFETVRFSLEQEIPPAPIEFIEVDTHSSIGSGSDFEDMETDTELTVYGFQRDIFLRVLFQMARTLHPHVLSPEKIYMMHIPEVLEKLMLEMDVGNKTLCDQLFETQREIIKTDWQMAHLNSQPKRKLILLTELPKKPRKLFS
ncbi:transcriptional regulator ATRX homolog, partial [Sitodiplosis mosellana]|uniref:transcriptional regulator ATRX homolog n=1 Tax=Sitodiplosis mosellana TaxID=263140 RepID=UPI002444A7E0